MPQRKALKGVAHGLLGTFVSRNNDIDGYWGLGVLRLFAEQNDFSLLTLDLLSDSLGRFPDSPLGIAEKTYHEWFRNVLQKSGVDVDNVARADISVRFSTFDEFPNTIRDTRGEPYLCTVTIVQANGNMYLTSKLGCCASHDPNSELRSNRGVSPFSPGLSEIQFVFAPNRRGVYHNPGMSTQLADILELPIKERIKLVEDIWDSIAVVPEAVELTDEQMAEIERRLEDYRANPKSVVPWEEVKARLRLRA